MTPKVPTAPRLSPTSLAALAVVPDPPPEPADRVSDDHAIDDPAEVLDSVRDFCARFIAYPSEHAATAHTLWCAHAHGMAAWESTPRIAFLSPEPGSGKSRALEVTELLVPAPVHAVNTTPAYLFRKVSDPAGPPTLLYDEVDTLFGPKAKDAEEIRGMLNAGHRRGATAGRCVIRGKTVETEELPAYCAVALAGLNDLPDTIATRSVLVRMRRRAPDEHVEPFRHRVHSAEGHALRDKLADWVAGVVDQLAAAWPKMPEGIEDRNADVWEALLAVADAAGGHWPETARVAAVALVADSRREGGSLGVLLLGDIRRTFFELGTDRVSTETLIDHLVSLDESPWGDLRGKPLDARGLSRRLGKYGIKPHVVRIGEVTPRGYELGDFHDVWRRYLVADVADVADSQPDMGADSGPNVAATEDPLLHSSRGYRGRESAPEAGGLLFGPEPATSATSATAAAGAAGWRSPKPHGHGGDECQFCAHESGRSASR